MYAVVGCTECATMWLLSDPGSNETARCPRCGRTHRTKKLKRFFESADREAARQARAALLAKKRGDSDAFADVDHVAELEARIEETGVDDREYLERSGVDADEVFEAGSTTGGGSRSRGDIVRDAVADADPPTEDAIVAYATARDVPADAARDLLEKLRRRGEVSETNGTYRLV